MLASISRFAALATLAATLVFSLAVPVELIDFNPSVITPSFGDVWVAGQNYTVTWNTTIPDGINPTQVPQTASLILGYLDDPTDPYSENLDWTLAENVPLYTNNGSYVVALPSNLTYKTSYVIDLLGSSGDISSQFTILPAVV